MDWKRMVMAFVVTALWDVALRMLSEEKVRFLGLEKGERTVALREYFRKHTLLAAALLAGFIGAVTFAVLELTWPHAKNTTWGKLLGYFVYVFVVSALMAIPIRLSKLFPHLEQDYYVALGIPKTALSDGASGVIVAVSLEAMAWASLL